MFPILLVSGVLKIYTLGFFLVLALFFGLFMLWKMIKLTSHKEEDVFDMFFISLLGSIFFARLVYVLSSFDKFKFDLLKFILINGYPGLSLFGALFGGILVLFLYVFRKKVAFLDIADYFVSPILLALGIGKIGSFLSGEESVIALVESILFFVFTYVSYIVVRAIRRGKFSSGTAFYFFLFTFSLTNLLLDNLKMNHLYFFRFSLNFAVSLVLFIATAAYFIYYFRKEIVAKARYYGTYIKRGNNKSSQKTHSS